MKFFQKQNSPNTAETAFHPQTVIRDWNNGDAFRLADAQTGVLITGSTGSGKTSGPGRSIAYGYLAAGFGGLILTAKRDECPMWQSWAADCGREKDLVIVNADGDWRFNVLEDEASRPGEGGGFSINIVALLTEIAGAIGGGEMSDSGSNKFWQDALQTLISNLVDLPLLAGLPVSLPLLRDIASSAPQAPEQLNDTNWQKDSACYQILKEADQATIDGDPEGRADFNECKTYFTKDFPSFAPETRGSIILGFSVLIRQLVTRPLRKLFSSDTNIRPADTFDGKLILVNLPVQEFKLAGRIANLLWKQTFQAAVLRRVQPADRRSFLRPVFLWADEAQNFVTKGDSEYQAVARSAGGCTVYLTQNIESFRRVLKNDDAVNSLLGNLQAKFFCQQSSSETNEWAARLLGERWIKITSTNAGTSGNDQTFPMQPRQQAGQNAGVTRSEQRRYFLEPAVFTTLKRGGPQYDCLVEAIVYNGGHLFGNSHGERLPYRKLTFTQK